MKPPTILPIDAMAIVKWIACEFLMCDLKQEDLKAAKAKLLHLHEKGKLLEFFQQSRGTGPDPFVDLWKLRLKIADEIRERERAAEPQPSTGR